MILAALEDQRGQRGGLDGRVGLWSALARTISNRRSATTARKRSSSGYSS